MFQPPPKNFDPGQNPLDESSDEIASLTEDDILKIRREKAALLKPAAPMPPADPDALPELEPDSDSVSEDDILGALDDASRKNVPKVYRPGDSRETNPTGPKSTKEYEAYKLKMQALGAQMEKLDEKSTIADNFARVGMTFVFTALKAFDGAWAKLPEDVRKNSNKQVKDVSGVSQINIGTFLPPRKTLEVIRALKAAGGIFRTYKAERAEIQKWLTDHLK